MEIMNVVWLGAALLLLVALSDRFGIANQDDCIVNWENGDRNESAESPFLWTEHQQ